MNQNHAVEKTINQIVRKWVKLHPYDATRVGLEDDFNDLASETKDGIEQRIKFIKDSLKTFQKLQANTKSEEKTIRLANYLFEKWRIELEEIRYWNKFPAITEYVIEALYPLIAIDYAPLSQRIEHLHARMKILPRRLKEIWQRVRDPVRPLIELELETITRLPGLFFHLQEVAREGAKAIIYRDIFKFSEKCLDEVEAMYQYVISNTLSDCDQEQFINPDIYHRYLSHLLNTKDIAGIVAIAEDRLENQMKRLHNLGNKVVRRQSVDVAVSTIKDVKAGNMQELLQYSKTIAAKAKEFAEENSFCDVPPKDTLYILEEPSCYVHYHPLYYYRNGGAFSKSEKGFLFLAASDCDLDKTRELNFPLVTAITTRYSYPGEHLYFAVNKARSSLLDSINDARFTIAGWREYSALKFNELGFEDTSKHAFMNTMSLARETAKFLAEIRLFTGKFSIKEATAYLARHSCFDWSITESEVNSIIVKPGEQMYAFYGWETINNLERDVKKMNKIKYKQSSFNNFILNLANYPVHLLKEDEIRLPAEKQSEAPAAKKVQQVKN